MKESKLYRKTKRLYIDQVRREFPLWFCSSLNPTRPNERFDLQLDEIKGVLTKRKGPKVTTVDALYVFSHLLNKWAGGILGYNAWYAVHTARDMGLLDRKLRPCAGLAVNENTRLLGELYKRGGSKAVEAYKKVIT